METEQIFSEIEQQRMIEKEARSRANSLERMVFRKISEELKLDKLVIHKETGTVGELHFDKDGGIIILGFYPLKKNGEVSAKSKIFLSHRIFTFNQKNLMKCLDDYSPA